ncbi:hypothetical protein nvc1_103 [Namao virus]|nr:hypothetical protein nvc1_103 [Namao virus]
MSSTGTYDNTTANATSVYENVGSGFFAYLLVFIFDLYHMINWGVFIVICVFFVMVLILAAILWLAYSKSAGSIRYKIKQKFGCNRNKKQNRNRLKKNVLLSK